MTSLSPRQPDDVRARAIRAEAMESVKEDAMSWLQFGACFVAGIVGTVFFWLMVALAFTF